MKYYIEASWEQTGFYVIDAPNKKAARTIAGDPDKWKGKHTHIDELPPPQHKPTDRVCVCGEIIPIASWLYCSEYCRKQAT